jgi:hypothetical protein
MNRKGRPPGAKNKLPNNEVVNELINTIVNDLLTNYAKLTTNQKIKILNELTANFVPPNQNHANNSNLNSF